MNKFIPALILISSLSGCATPTMTGLTLANDVLQKDTINLLKPFARAKLDCNNIASIHASADSISPEGVVTENWNVSGCGQSFMTQVVFIPSTSGGVDIVIKPVP